VICSTTPHRTGYGSGIAFSNKTIVPDLGFTSGVHACEKWLAIKISYTITLSVKEQ
jgi:hypothetical protein